MISVVVVIVEVSSTCFSVAMSRKNILFFNISHHHQPSIYIEWI